MRIDGWDENRISLIRINSPIIKSTSPLVDYAQIFNIFINYFQTFLSLIDKFPDSVRINFFHPLNFVTLNEL